MLGWRVAVLCITGFWTLSLTSTHQMPVASSFQLWQPEMTLDKAICGSGVGGRCRARSFPVENQWFRRDVLKCFSIRQASGRVMYLRFKNFIKCTVLCLLELEKERNQYSMHGDVGILPSKGEGNTEGQKKD